MARLGSCSAIPCGERHDPDEGEADARAGECFAAVRVVLDVHEAGGEQAEQGADAQGRAAEALVAQTRQTEAASRRAAALDERTRIAREIHDVLAHALGGLTVQLEAAELVLAERRDIDGALERIRGCQRTAREGLVEARRAVAALRSDAPPLPESLAGLLESHRQQGDRGSSSSKAPRGPSLQS